MAFVEGLVEREVDVEAGGMVTFEFRGFRSRGFSGRGSSGMSGGLGTTRGDIIEMSIQHEGYVDWEGALDAGVRAAAR
ncbi:hypothetical protein [Streptomyces sp. NPDC020480]|uniref:hypothetical protein n=1 Tax=Streptomyces sp. NPDC020480 TaxID=3365076 RepID=UPI0037A22208